MAGKFCPKCGASLNETAKFCVMCGFSVQPRQAAPVPAPATLKQLVEKRCRELGIPDDVSAQLHIDEDYAGQGAIGIVSRGMFLFTYKNLTAGVHTFLYMGTSKEEAVQALEKAVLEAAAGKPAAPKPAVRPVIPATAFQLPDLPVDSIKEEAPADPAVWTFTDPVPPPVIDQPVITEPADIPLPVAEHSTSEEPTFEEPVITAPMPSIDETAFDEPVIADPMPVIDETAFDEPVITEAAVIPQSGLDDLLPVNNLPDESATEDHSAEEAGPVTDPRTLDELSAWYKAAGLPPYEESGFYIGNTDARSVFGIRADGDQFEVYRNKHDGTRKVFYRGSDEASAVNGFYNTIRQRMGLADASEFTARKAIEN